MNIDKLKKILLIALLIAVEQGIKLIIKFNFMNSNRIIISDIFRFKPIINDKLSWINSWLNLGIGYYLHIIVNILGILMIYYLYRFYIHIKKKSAIITASYLFIMAGAVCSLIDKVFWGGSLDYIMYSGFMGGYTFDLKDVYINGSLVALGGFLIFSAIKDKGFEKSVSDIKTADLTGLIKEDLKSKLYTVKAFCMKIFKTPN